MTTATAIKLPDIEHLVYIGALPSRVYDALTQASALNKWWTNETSLETKIAGEINFVWKNWGPQHVDYNARARFGELVPNEKIVWEWLNQTDPSQGVESVVTFYLEPRANGTVVNLTHCGLNNADIFQGVAVGWGEALTLLKFYLEHGITYGCVPQPNREAPQTFASAVAI